MNAKLVVQSLQSTRAQILWAVFFAGHGVDVDELREWTGRDRKTHYGHLNALCGARLLAKQTLAHGRVVYMLGPEMAPFLREWVGQLDMEVLELPDPDKVLEGQESGFRTSGKDVVVNAESKLISPTITTIITTKSQESGFRTSEQWSALTAALNEYKIVGKKRRELIECEWVDADYVRASVKYAVDERIWDNPVGTAITRMLDHLPVSEGQDDQVPGPKAEGMTITTGRGKRESTLIISAELVKAAAEFTGHAERCSCLDCSTARLHGTSWLCPKCRHFNCDCEESEEE